VFGIHTVPSGAEAPSVGCGPAFTVATTSFVAGSIRETAFACGCEAHTASGEAASQAGPSAPVSIGVTRFVAGSIRKTCRPWVEPTQTEPNAHCSPAGAAPGVRSRFTTRFLAGSIRETQPEPLSVDHTAPPA
jgi:hypothetical protein